MLPKSCNVNGNLKTFWLIRFNTPFTIKKIGDVDHIGLSRSDIFELNNYAGPENYIVCLVSSRVLVGSNSPLLKNHWIVWTDKLRDSQGGVINNSSSNPHV